MKKTILIGFLTVGIIVFSSYYYVMNYGARNLSTEEAVFTVSSKNISSEFTSNTEMANKKYIDKAIAIKGFVTKVTGKEIIIDNSIICNLKEIDETILKDQMITLKGRVVGFDDLMGELKLDQCIKTQ